MPARVGLEPSHVRGYPCSGEQLYGRTVEHDEVIDPERPARVVGRFAQVRGGCRRVHVGPERVDRRIARQPVTWSQRQQLDELRGSTVPPRLIGDGSSAEFDAECAQHAYV
ncbi:MAG: hypothetical protein GEU80_15645 [Dehalococcoidia bacterium]|nr:hypothetical protein [Dehalococcoidia bacterium]